MQSSTFPRLRALLLSVALATGAGACSDSAGPPALASIEVSAPSHSVYLGQTLALSATASDDKGNPMTGQAMSWSSSNTAVATVADPGIVTGVGPGSATVTASSGGRSGTFLVTVLPRVELSTSASTLNAVGTVEGSSGITTCDARWTARVAGTGGTWGNLSWTITPAAGTPETGSMPILTASGQPRSLTTGAEEFGNAFRLASSQAGVAIYRGYTVQLRMSYTDAGSATQRQTDPVSVTCRPPGFIFERFKAADVTKLNEPQLQARLLDTVSGKETFLYGTFSNSTTPATTSTVAVKQAREDSVTMYLLDASGAPSTIYRASGSGSKSNAVLQLDPISATQMYVRGYRYNWTIGAGKLILRSLVTRQADGSFTAVNEFLDTTTASGPAVASAGRLLQETLLPAGRRIVLDPKWVQQDLQRLGECDDFKGLVTGISSSLVANQWMKKLGITMMTGGGVAALYGALALTGTAAATVAAGGLVVALGGAAIVWPTTAGEIVSGLANGIVGNACGGEMKDPTGRPNPSGALTPPSAAPYARGTVGISDNGNLADDAFGVLLDGQPMGQTSIGASNTLGLGALRPGNHQLTVQVIIAPDNVGTWQLVLGGGLKFSDGTTSKSGSSAAGASVSFTIVVPSS